MVLLGHGTATPSVGYSLNRIHCMGLGHVPNKCISFAPSLGISKGGGGASSVSTHPREFLAKLYLSSLLGPTEARSIY